MMSSGRNERASIMFLRTIFALLFSVLFSLAAQAQDPTGLWVTPSIYKFPGSPYCYTLTVGNGANMTVDVAYTLNSGSQQFLIGWPALNANGQAYICTDSATSTGQYVFTGVRRTQSGTGYLAVNAPLTVAAVPSQPSSLTFNGLTSTSGYAGNDGYVMHAGNAGGTTVDLQFSINGMAQGTYSQGLNSNGDWNYTLGHSDGLGAYHFTGIRNSNRIDWVPLAVTYTVLPPKPTSMAISPASVVAGGSYTMTVGNGANIALDVQYTLNTGSGDGPLVRINNWPWLAPGGTSPNGQAVIQVGPCTFPGVYTYRNMKNTQNAESTWQSVPVPAPIAVTAPPAPTLTSRTPIAALPGTSGNITINGTNLCGVTLSSDNPHLSFGTIPDVPYAAGTSVATTFTVGSGAQPGVFNVVLSGRGGTTSFPFSIASTSPPTITGFSPPSVAAGSTSQVTVSGTNLIGGMLTTNYSGITFDNASNSYNSAGTSLTARFIAAAGTAAGQAAITVTTSAGSATAAYSVTPAGSGTIALNREYIYLGSRLLAVESPSSQPSPPSPPTIVTAQAQNPNTVLLNWTAGAAAPGLSVSSYQVKRSGVVVANLGPGQLSFTDTTASQHTTYTFTAVVQDSGAQTATSAGVSVTTPWENIPPSTPTNLDIPSWGDTWSWLTWSPSTDSGGSGLAGYYVGFIGTNEQFSGLIPVSETGFFIDFTWWPDWDWSYFAGFDVWAVDNAGNLSAPGHWP